MPNHPAYFGAQLRPNTRPSWAGVYQDGTEGQVSHGNRQWLVGSTSGEAAGMGSQRLSGTCACRSSLGSLCRRLCVCSSAVAYHTMWYLPVKLIRCAFLVPSLWCTSTSWCATARDIRAQFDLHCVVPGGVCLLLFVLDTWQPI